MRNAKELIEEFNLLPHPEGGYFKEVYRAGAEVEYLGRGVIRSAATLIYYLLKHSQFSAWHQVASDEIWQHAEGAPLELHVLTPDFSTYTKITLGPLCEGLQNFFVVPAGFWQAAVSQGDYTLVMCTVSPGFDFEDFALLRGNSALSSVLAERFPQLMDLQ